MIICSLQTGLEFPQSALPESTASFQHREPDMLGGCILPFLVHLVGGRLMKQEFAECIQQSGMRFFIPLADAHRVVLRKTLFEFEIALREKIA